MRTLSFRSQRAAALIIVLAFVVLLTGLTVAYFAQTVADRQIAHSSFNQSNADQIAHSAVGIILGDLRQEIVNGSAGPAPSFGPASSPGPYYVYTPTAPANVAPKRSGTPAARATPIPNLVRRSIRDDPITSPPGLASRASAVNSTTDASANGRAVTLARWNKHYLIPKLNSGPGDETTDPVSSFVAPDWVMVTAEQGAAILTTPKTDSNGNVVTPVGRYAYTIYDEGGLLDINVVGYPSGTSAVQSGRKGSPAFADLAALGAYPIPNSSTPYQVDRIIGWRNYATTQAANKFLATNFANNLQGSVTAMNYYNYVTNNTTGFLSVRSTASPSPYPWNDQTDQMFVSRQELISFRKLTQFSVNALQYLGTFSREINSPLFSPATPAGSTIDYAALASSATAVNPNFLLRRVQGIATGVFTRFDNSPANGGEPLVKTRFPLSRLAWITYKGPSAVVYAANSSDPVITQLTALGVPLPVIQTGTVVNIQKCFGLVWDTRTYVPASGTTPSTGQQWVYVSPSSANGGGTFSGTSGNPASIIKRLDTVVSENREPDFFELLRATILDGSLGQNTGGGVTGGATVFPDLHMSNKDHHVLSIGAAIIDQADPDSIPTRIQFKPTAATGTNWWTAYGVESLPYITQIYPITGASPATASKWATYLLFQLLNPHNNNGAALSPAPPQVRLRVDGGIGLFTGGNGQTYATSTAERQTSLFTGGSAGQSIAFTVGAFPSSASPTPVATPGVATVPAVGSVSTSGPGGFERLPGSAPMNNNVGLRILPDHTVTPASSGNPPQVTLFFGTDSSHQFNATMEYLVPGTTTSWVPYNHFIGINDQRSWINGATAAVRDTATTGIPNSSSDTFTTSRLLDSPKPYSFMKADPRATRFGIFQVDTNFSTSLARITQPLWPNGASIIANGYGGGVADGSPPVPGNPLEHVPLRFAGSAYYPATLCINDGQPNSVRHTAATSYADNDGIVRPADAAYPDPTRTSTGSSTPWSSYTVTPNTFRPYWPIMLNRPFRSVAELGYVFRDLPWKSLDLYSDRSADAGLLEAFSITDEPAMIAGRVNLNTSQSAPLQAILAGSIWDELTPANAYPKTGSASDSAQTMAPLVLSATSAAPFLSKSDLISRAGLPNQILPVYTGTTANQTDQLVKTQREAVPRALASAVQTRTWNLMIDVIAQSGRYPPTATTAADLPNLIVEGEQRYWVHVAIDRFTGQVIDRQVEIVKE